MALPSLACHKRQSFDLAVSLLQSISKLLGCGFDRSERTEASERGAWFDVQGELIEMERPPNNRIQTDVNKLSSLIQGRMIVETNKIGVR